MPLSATRPLDTSLYRLEKSRIFGWPRGKNDFKEPFENLNHRFFDFIEISFWACQEAENELAVLCNHYKSSFNDIRQVSFWAGPEAENRLNVPCGPLKQRFLDLNKFAFWDSEEAENEFKVTCEQLKHRFLDFNLVDFGLNKRKQMSCKCLSTI